MLDLNIHGYRIRIECYPTSPKSIDLVRLLEFDFHQFKVTPLTEQSQVNLRVRILESLKPPRFRIPILKRRKLIRFWSPGSKTWYQERDHYQAQFTLNPVRALEVTFENLESAHENVYLFLLSCIGEFFERRGLHRLHAVGYKNGPTAYVIPLNSGKGKSTFSSWILENTESLVVGDETLFTDGIQIWPFPIRRAIRKANSIDSGKQLKAWPADRVSLSSAPFKLVLFRDQFSGLRFFWTFFWGLGNAQMIEYLVRWDTLFWLPRMALSRIRVFKQMQENLIELESWSRFPSENFQIIEKVQKDLRDSS